MNKIRIAQKPDWDSFFKLAAGEGWRVPEVERQLFAGQWFDCARVLEEGDSFCGLVTSVAHEHSGWIGNLIVEPEHRSRGIGRRLMEHGIDHLHRAGAATIRLEGDPPGIPLYRSLGFVDEFESCRFALPPSDDRRATADLKNETMTAEDFGEVAALDRRIVGPDRRS